jgi:hypothetical protein
MTSLFKKLRSPSFIFFSCVLVVSALVAILSKPYFTEPVFYIDQHKYAFEREQGSLVTYRSGTAVPVQVRTDGQSHTVTINRIDYVITKNSDPYNIKYNVTYPNGHRYEVQDQSGNLLSYDEKGEVYFPNQVYIGDQRVKGEDEEAYHPAELVRAAFSEYHDTPGVPGFLFLALCLLIYGWCGYRYRKVQDVMFFLSLQWLWVNDPEPSDFYYFMSQVGGILVMIGSVIIAFKAF